MGSGRETMTVFHPDHDDLVLTHYCAQGNQPRLRVAELTKGAVASFDLGALVETK